MKFTQLISTSNEERISNNNVIYLGHWCRTDGYIIKDELVAKYHWDNRDKLEKDYNYLINFYERILSELSKILNQFHSKSYSVNYWRITVGYWLLYYLSVNFERWENINSVLEEFNQINFDQTLSIKHQPIPSTTREFMNLSSDVKWNHITYTKIIKFINDKKKINIRFIDKEYKNEKFYYNYRTSLKHNLKSFLIKFYIKIFKEKIKNNKIVFFKTYLGLFNEIKLNLKYKQFPLFLLNKKFEKIIDTSTRNSLKLKIVPKNLFEEFILEDIFKSIPTDFLENFKKIEEYINSIGLPNYPEIIFSTRTLASDNIFVRYIAMKKENGSKFIYAQHGGVYGHIKYSWAEDHEIEISDAYLTWGWKKDDTNKVKPFYIIKDINKIKFTRSKELKSLCYFIRSRVKYTGRIDASTGTNQMSKYYKNSLEFAKDLKTNYKFKIVPRFHEANFEWNHFNIWKKHNFDKFSFTDTESLDYVYKNYDLIVYSYISTGFLESLSLNKPFLLISSLKEWPLRENVLEDFNKLEKVKIFFRDLDKAKLHLKNISENINDWWDSKEVIKVKNYFKEKYARIDSDDRRREDLYNIINKLSIDDK